MKCKVKKALLIIKFKIIRIYKKVISSYKALVCKIIMSNKMYYSLEAKLKTNNSLN